jgi:hypothetical protein
MKRLWAVVALCLAAPAVAEPPVSSPRPVPRATIVAETSSHEKLPLVRPVPRTIATDQGEVTAVAVADVPLAEYRSVLGAFDPLQPPRFPQPATAPMGLILPTENAVLTSVRPATRLREDRSMVTRSRYRADQAVTAISPLAVPLSQRPLLRPAALTQRAEEARAAILRGSVCGDPAIQGEVIGAVGGRGSCGIESAVRLRSVAGVTFGGERPQMDCQTARALKTWIERGARPAVGTTGGGLSQIQVMGSYSCRPRNNQSGERLSEHSFGRAIDIGGFKLADGTTFTVLRDWGSQRFGGILRQMHSKACGPFGTVLGPNANAYHRNHFHFDTARYRAGSYCR